MVTILLGQFLPGSKFFNNFKKDIYIISSLTCTF